MEGAPGAADGFQPARAFANARRLDEELPAGRTFRREWQAGRGTGGTRAEGKPPHGREPTREWRTVSEGIDDAGFSGLRGGRGKAGGGDRRGHSRTRKVFARRDETEQR